MNKQAVICRYKEDVSWVEGLNFDYIICNKGTDEVPYNSVKVENFGRESRAFLTFIISNYDQIKDSNVYCNLQGRPFDHLVTIEEINDVGYVDFKPFGKRRFTEGLKGPVNNHFPLGLPLVEMCDLLFKTNPLIKTNVISFILGGQFAVSGKRIRHRDIQFYKYLHAILGKRNPLEGHMVERIWHLIFDDTIEDRFTNYFNARKRCVENASWQGELE